MVGLYNVFMCIRCRNVKNHRGLLVLIDCQSHKADGPGMKVSRAAMKSSAVTLRSADIIEDMN